MYRYLLYFYLFSSFFKFLSLLLIAPLARRVNITYNMCYAQIVDLFTITRCGKQTFVLFTNDFPTLVVCAKKRYTFITVFTLPLSWPKHMSRTCKTTTWSLCCYYVHAGRGSFVKYVCLYRHFINHLRPTDDWIREHTFYHPQKSRRAVEKSTLAYAPHHIYIYIYIISLILVYCMFNRLAVCQHINIYTKNKTYICIIIF